MIKRKMAKSIVAIDFFFTFKVWSELRARGFDWQIQDFLNALYTVVGAADFGFKTCFAGLPENPSDEEKEFLKILEKADFMLSLTPLANGREKQVDQKLADWLKNIAIPDVHVILFAGDQDFVPRVKDLKSRGIETTLIYGYIPESINEGEPTSASKELMETCSAKIDVMQWTDNTKLFRPFPGTVKNSSSLNGRIQQAFASAGTQTNTQSLILAALTGSTTSENTATQRTTTASARTSNVPKQKLLQAVKQAVQETFSEKSAEYGYDVSFVSQGAVKHKLYEKGINLPVSLNDFLKEHSDVFFTGEKRSASGVTFPTVSLRKQSYYVPYTGCWRAAS